MLEDAFVSGVRAGRVGHDIEVLKDRLAVGGDSKNALPLAARFGTDEIGQPGLREMKVHLVRPGLQGNVVTKLANPEMAVDVGIQRSQNPLGRAHQHRTAGEEAIGPPRAPTPVEVGTRAHEKPQISTSREHHRDRRRNDNRFGDYRDWIGRARQPQRVHAYDYYQGCGANDRWTGKRIASAGRARFHGGLGLQMRRCGNRLFRRRRAPCEQRAIRSWRQVDFDRMVSAVLGQILLCKLLAHFVGGHTNDRVLTGIEILWKLEDLHANGAFLESASRPAYGVNDDVLEELPASLARAKGGSLQQTGQFR
jgi:hypothetical protein